MLLTNKPAALITERVRVDGLRLVPVNVLAHDPAQHLALFRGVFDQIGRARCSGIGFLGCSGRRFSVGGVALLILSQFSRLLFRLDFIVSVRGAFEDGNKALMLLDGFVPWHGHCISRRLGSIRRGLV